MSALGKYLALLLLASGMAFGQHSVALSWTWTQGTGDPATSFIVQRSTVSGGPYTTICGATGQPVCPVVTLPMTFLDSTVVGGSTVFYVVKASGPGGVSLPSNELKAVIPFLPPAPPQNLSATVV